MVNQELHTSRLILRPIRESDAEAVYSYRSLPAIARYQYWEPYTREDAEIFVRKNRNGRLDQRDEWIGLAMILRENGELIGDCALKISRNSAEIGCNVSPAFQGNGLAREAVQMLIDFSFNHNGIKTVYGITDAQNEASIRLLKSLGMKQDPSFEERLICKGNWCTEYKYLIRHD